MSQKPLPASSSTAKPLLRGYLHLGAAVVTVIATIVLLALAAGDSAKQVSLLVYGASAELLFAMSALYHIGNWRPRARALLRRLDHANIFVLIAGTYTPIAFNVMAGRWRVGILTAVWVLALTGVVIAAAALPLPRWAMVGFYIATGWVALAAIPEIVSRTRAGGVLLLVLGGLLYTAGALAYALKKPALWPRVFGYHELFHLATIAANTAFLAFMIAYVLPLAR